MPSRCTSATATAASRWLPWYHDMGLVGCLLSLIANQMSVDYLKTEDFARRPLAWLDLISRNEGTTLSYSPTFGYDICARRISSQSNVAERFDLSRWRLAGNGADMIRPDVMQSFVNAFADAGFKASALHCPSYGLAEATLAVTVMPPGEGIRVELVEEERLLGQPARPDRAGRALPRDRQLRQAGARHGGRDPRRERQARTATTRSARSGAAAPSVMHSLLPRRGSDRRLPRSTAGSTPATWATSPTATCSSSAGRRT